MVRQLDLYPGDACRGIGGGVFADHALALYIWGSVKEEVKGGEDAGVEAEEDEDKVHDLVGHRVLLRKDSTLAKTQPLTW